MSAKKFKHGVTVYSRRERKGPKKYNSWELRYTYVADSNRIRIRKRFNSQDTALDEADTVVKRFENGHIALANLTPEQRARELAELERLRTENADLRAKLAPPDLEGRAMRVPDLVEKLWRAAEDDGKAQRTVEDLRTRGRRIAKDFQCPVASLKADDVDRWLRKFPGKRTRNHYRDTFLDIIRGAKTLRLLPKHWSELDDLPRAIAEDPAIIIYSPDQFITLTDSAQQLIPALVPYLAIAAFAAVRSAELARMDWIANVRIDDLEGRVTTSPISEIFLRKDQSKTRRDRVIPIPKNLAAWLAPYKNDHGPVSPYQSADALHAALRKIAAHAGLPWIPNALRKSCISYWAANGVDLQTIADWSGNSISKIREYYLRRPSRALAQKWFDLPPPNQRVLELFRDVSRQKTAPPCSQSLPPKTQHRQIL